MRIVKRKSGVNRLPAYFRQEIPNAAVRRQLTELREAAINTVCVSAHCPNITSCFNSGTATFMILGDTCSRNCSFCAVKKANGAELTLDPDEPGRVAVIAKNMRLKYVVVTSVTRDDLPDAGAGQFSRTIKAIRASLADVKIEALIPDFSGSRDALKNVVDAGPSVIAHNLETLPRLYSALRPQADYHRSLDVLKAVKQFRPDIITKSSLLLGVGEREEEVHEVMRDLLSVNCDILTLGQYLSPSENHYPVKEFIPQEEFSAYRDVALSLGFKSVLAGPKVRSSYKAEEVYKELVCTI